jgi:nitroimidazol reductase NimA-like FMN-containing flavoprotein (pyridoxamine 5'-phosphate oxidase superfamily)
LETLSPQQCLELLAQSNVGRLVYEDQQGPVAEPVNYVIAHDSIIFRAEGGRKREAMTQSRLAFEVDCIDDNWKSGWSVLARGEGCEVPLDEVPQLLHELREQRVGPPKPWASGIHKVWLRFTIDSLSGRRLGSEAAPLVF